MKKGVSAVIATILMLIITIALAGMAYMYISGVFTGVTQGIEVSDSYCSEQTGSASEDEAVLIIKNIGTTKLTSITCIQTSPVDENLGICNGTSKALANVDIDAGQTQTFEDLCDGTGSGRSCTYRLTPGVGKTITASIYCT